MQTFFSSVQENAQFFLACVLIVVGIALLARLAEHFLPETRKVSPARRVCIVGICAAIATVLHILDFPVPFLAPGFYKLDFSEVPVMLCGFFLGPSAAVVCEGVKVLLKLLLKSTSTAFVGDLANFVVGCSFLLPAAICYHVHKTRRAALVGLILGTVCMTIFGTAFNAVYLLPKFAQLYGMPMDAIIGLGSQIHAGVTGIGTFVVLCVAPLNLLKGAAVSLLTMLLYKRVAAPLFKIHR